MVSLEWHTILFMNKIFQGSKILKDHTFLILFSFQKNDSTLLAETMICSNKSLFSYSILLSKLEQSWKVARIRTSKGSCLTSSLRHPRPLSQCLRMLATGDSWLVSCQGRPWAATIMVQVIKSISYIWENLPGFKGLVSSLAKEGLVQSCRILRTNQRTRVLLPRLFSFSLSLLSTSQSSIYSLLE